MNMSTVVSSWKKSLEFFKKDNLKLYVLITLNTILRSSKILLRNFWWLLLADLVCAWIGTAELYLVSLGINCLLLYVAIMTVRPSLEAKEYSYYISYSKGIWVVALLLLSTCFLNNIFAFFVLPLAFFFFDSNLGLRGFATSCKQWVKMLILFTPTLIGLFIVPIFTILLWTAIVFGIFLLPVKMFEFLLFRTLIFSVLYPIFYFFALINITVISVLYTKLKHENFNLLFQ